MLTHYKGTCHPPHSSRCAASNLSLGSGAPANLLLPPSPAPPLSFSLFLFVLTAFVQYIHRLARLDSETRFQTPDHASSTGAPPRPPSRFPPRHPFAPSFTRHHLLVSPVLARCLRDLVFTPSSSLSILPPLLSLSVFFFFLPLPFSKYTLPSSLAPSLCS